jgi:hypothetical protein
MILMMDIAVIQMDSITKSIFAATEKGEQMRLIDADKVLEFLEYYPAFRCSGADITDLCEILDDTPTIDAKPVVHGEWYSEYMFEDWDGNRVYEHHHLECGYRHRNHLDKETANYCPNCGADMRERKENG